jgi:hypothetical protein
MRAISFRSVVGKGFGARARASVSPLVLLPLPLSQLPPPNTVKLDDASVVVHTLMKASISVSDAPLLNVCCV